MDIDAHRIRCPKFGGQRFAPACCTQDAYRSCRRRCASLAQHLVKHPELPEEAKRYYREREKKDTTGGLFKKTAVYALKGLPGNLNFKCPRCNFVAKSARGLKMHQSRRFHKVVEKEGRKRENRTTRNSREVI